MPRAPYIVNLALDVKICSQSVIVIMDSEGTVSNAFALRGSEYIIGLSWENEDNVTIEVEDKSTSEQWRATFDAPCKFSANYF